MTSRAPLEQSIALLRSLGCHSIVLYGSRARGDFEPQSDLDLAAFRDLAPGEGAIRDSRTLEAPEGPLQLDAWLYPTAQLIASPDLLHLAGGQAVLDERGLLAPVLTKLTELVARGPGPLPSWDAEQRQQWARKCLLRAGRGGPEGDLRRHWLLYQSLEDRQRLRGEWYLGSKATLAHLAQHHPDEAQLCSQALAPDATLDAIDAWIRRAYLL